MEKPFAQEFELKQKTARLDELTHELAMDTKDVAMEIGGDDAPEEASCGYGALICRESRKRKGQERQALDLLSYMRLYEPQNLVRKGNDYCTKEHDNLIISENGLWHWKSRDIGGKTALQYLIKVRNMDFVTTVLQLCNGMPAQNTETRIEPKKKKPFVLPAANSNNRMVIEYLRRRGIADDIIQYCISKGHGL